MRNNSAWGGIATSALLILNGGLLLIFGDGVFRDVVIPSWVGWPELLIGILVFGFSLWGLLHKETKQQIDREAVEAKKKMDQMYFNEYGVWPDYKEVTEVLPENEAKSDQASAGSEAGNANLKATTPSETKPPVP